MGSAIIAAVASGVYKGFVEAADNMVTFADKVKPNMDNHRKYKVIVDEYIKTYYALRESQYLIDDYIKGL